MFQNLYDEVTKQIPNIGDYVVDSTYDVGIVIGIDNEQECENGRNRKYYRIFYLHPEDVRRDAYNHGDCYINDIETITPKLANILLSVKGENRYFLYSLIFNYRFHDEINREKDELFYKYLEDYLNGSINSIVSFMLFNIGIKKIINREKNSAKRIVEFNDGQIWVVHREKRKITSNRRNIIRYNVINKESRKIKSVKYSLVKRLK